MKRLGLFFATAVLALGAAQAAAEEGDAVASIGAFQFERGRQIAAMQVGYSLHGHLNAAHDNAVLLLPPTSGGRHSYDALIGPGKPFDTERFLIITVDPIGGGASSNPADGLGAQFPRYTIRDMVAAEARLIHDVLKIEHLHAVAGASMGSFQALEWAVHQPIPIGRLVLVAPAARSDAHFRAIADGMEAVLGGNDPHWSAAARLRAAAALFMPWLRSDAYLVRQGEASNHAEVEALARSWTRNWDPISLLYRYRASAVHDVGVPFGNDVQAALARVKARTLVVDISSDRTVPSYLTEELLKKLPNAQEVRVETDHGHSAFLAPPGSRESNAIWKPIAEFLEADAK